MTNEFFISYCLPVLRKLAQRTDPTDSNPNRWAIHIPVSNINYSFSYSYNRYKCKICFQYIYCDVNENELEEHGIKHLQERNLLPFI